MGEPFVVESRYIDIHVGLLNELLFPFAHRNVTCDQLVQPLGEQDFFTGDDGGIGPIAIIHHRLVPVADEH